MEKIARLCWNTNEWRRPSGRKGKSGMKEAYENENGFGHEEWLLDDSKIMPDGYHYAFLEQLRIQGTKHHGKVYDIHLYTFSPTRQWVYIGCLKRAVGVSTAESKKVYDYYEKMGWIEDMKKDVLYVGGTVRDFEPTFMFNVKFKYEDAVINYSNQPILTPGSIPSPRYNFMDKKRTFEFKRDEDGNIKMLDTSIFERVVEGGKIQIDPLHKKIQNAVAEILKVQYTKIQLESNPEGAEDQRIDIKGFSKKEQEWHFFEIKTVSAKRCIREAFGQILEYAHYPNVTRAKKFFIIGPEPPDDNDKAYMQLLRERYNLPIWFRWFSLKDNKLHERV